MGYLVTTVLMGAEDGQGPEMETELAGYDLSLARAQEQAKRLADRHGLVVRRIRQERRPSHPLDVLLNAVGTAALVALVLLG